MISYSGSPALELRAGDSRAIVLRHGAQVVSWTIAGLEQLYVSPAADFRDGAAIRGGVPVCFPQFDQRGPLRKHGFVRNLRWDIDSQTATAEDASVRLLLRDSESTRAEWPHTFRAALIVQLGRDWLDLQLSVDNPGSTALEFTGALHTYLRVNDQPRASLNGMVGVEYRDHRTGESNRDAQQALPVSAIGRTYREPGGPLELVDGDRRIAISARGFGNVVVWNPGMDPSFTDLPPAGWRDFLCVEAAQIDRPVTLQSGASWSGGQHLHVCY